MNTRNLIQLLSATALILLSACAHDRALAEKSSKPPVIIGYIAGNSYQAVEHVLGRASWVLLGLIVVGAVFVVVRRKRRTPIEP